MIRLILLAILFWTSSVAEATTWYVKTPASGGSDFNSCNQAQTQNAAKETINGALACIGGYSHEGKGAGHTVEIFAGTYTERLDELPGGTASGGYFTLKAHNSTGARLGSPGPDGDNVIIQQFAGAPHSIQLLGGGKPYDAYIRIQGIHFRGNANEYGAQLNSSYSRYLQIYGNEFSNGLGSICCAGEAAFWDIRYNNFHDYTGAPFMGTTQYGYPIYLSSAADMTVEGNRFDNFPLYGLHGYNSIINPARFIVRYNTFSNFGWGHSAAVEGQVPEVGGGVAILVYAGPDHQIYGNLIYNGYNTVGDSVGGIHSWSATNTQIYNNTIYNIVPSNGNGMGIMLDNASSATVRNNITSGNSRNYAVTGTPPVAFGSNLCSAGTSNSLCTLTEVPSNTFVAPGSNFQIKAASLAISAGQNLGPPYNSDIIGATRPASPASWTIGAYEYGAPPPVVTPALVLAFNFDEGQGTTVQDRSGNNNNGTLLTGATWANP